MAPSQCYTPRAPPTDNVRHPQHYCDPGPRGWYSELQYPHRCRLEIKYSRTHNGDCYIRPDALLLLGVASSTDLQWLRWDFGRFGTILSIEKLPSRQGSLPPIVIIFGDASDAAKAMYWATYNFSLPYKVKYKEINTTGPNAWKPTNILLVREGYDGPRIVPPPNCPSTTAILPVKPLTPAQSGCSTINNKRCEPDQLGEELAGSKRMRSTSADDSSDPISNPPSPPNAPLHSPPSPPPPLPSRTTPAKHSPKLTESGCHDVNSAEKNVHLTPHSPLPQLHGDLIPTSQHFGQRSPSSGGDQEEIDLTLGQDPLLRDTPLSPTNKSPLEKGISATSSVNLSLPTKSSHQGAQKVELTLSGKTDPRTGRPPGSRLPTTPESPFAILQIESQSVRELSMTRIKTSPSPSPSERRLGSLDAYPTPSTTAPTGVEQRSPEIFGPVDFSKWATDLRPEQDYSLRPPTNLGPTPSYFGITSNDVLFVADTKEQVIAFDKTLVPRHISTLSDEELQQLGLEEKRVWSWNVSSKTRGYYVAAKGSMAIPASR